MRAIIKVSEPNDKSCQLSANINGVEAVYSVSFVIIRYYDTICLKFFQLYFLSSNCALLIIGAIAFITRFAGVQVYQRGFFTCVFYDESPVIRSFSYKLEYCFYLIFIETLE